MARIFITGSMDGLGRAAAGSLIRDGHEVVLHARSVTRAHQPGAILAGAADVVFGDLASALEVRALAEQVNRIGRMDAVIHNAGLYLLPDRCSTPEGHPTLLAVNSLAPYLLSALLDRPRRQVYLSSGLHRSGEGSLSDFDWKARRWDPMKAYAESKLHVAALASALSRLWPDVISNAVDPGWVRTKMGGPSAPVDLDTGQRTQSWLAASEDPAARTSGGYWHHMRLEAPAAEVLDRDFQKDLLSELEWLTGIGLSL